MLPNCAEAICLVVEVYAWECDLVSPRAAGMLGQHARVNLR